MAEDALNETDQSETITKRNPHDIIGVAGIIRAHSKDVEAKKLKIRMENELYLIQHPEINVMISLFMKHVLDEHPDDILKYAGAFFDRPNLKELVRWEFD
jgi:hypothetical protein